MHHWWAKLAFFFGMTCLPVMACAHPHGAVDCRAELRFESAQLRYLRGELWLDTWHSQRAWQLTRDGLGQPDAEQTRKFIFALKMQMGRANWLFGVQADGQHLALTPKDDPALDFSADGRARIVIDYAVQATGQPAQRWSLHCADPGYYFVTAFGQQLQVSPPQGLVQEIDTAKLADNLARLEIKSLDTNAVTVQGCTALRMGSADTALPAPRPGMARMDWICPH